MVAVDEIVAAKQRRASIFCINILKLSEQEKAFFFVIKVNPRVSESRPDGAGLKRRLK